MIDEDLRECERVIFMELTGKYPWLLRKHYREGLLRFCALATRLGLAGHLRSEEMKELGDLQIWLHMEHLRDQQNPFLESVQAVKIH